MSLYGALLGLMLIALVSAGSVDTSPDEMTDYVLALTARNMCRSDMDRQEWQDKLRELKITPNRFCQCTIAATVHNLQDTREAKLFAIYKLRASQTGEDVFLNDEERKAQEAVLRGYQKSTDECTA